MKLHLYNADGQTNEIESDILPSFATYNNKIYKLYASGGCAGSYEEIRIVDLNQNNNIENEVYQYLKKELKRWEPKIEPLPTLLGLCTQIDNYVSGLSQDMKTTKTYLDKIQNNFIDIWATINKGNK